MNPKTVAFASVLLALVLLPVSFAVGYALKSPPKVTASVLLAKANPKTEHTDEFYYVVTSGPLKGEYAPAETVLEVGTAGQPGKYVRNECDYYYDVKPPLGNRYAMVCTFQDITKQEAAAGLAATAPGLTG